MDILEIRNNLVKIAYSGEDNVQLGQFIALTSDEKSYVAQYINLKSDSLNNFAVAKLLFTFSSDGIVNNYDGTIPTSSYNIVNLPADELLSLLPVETPIKIGNLAGQDSMLNVDISIFEHNFTIFVNNDLDKRIVISNFVRQLFRLKEKSVVIDLDGNFSEFDNLALCKDFKLPLNDKMINYIFEYDLKEVDNNTKAVIQEIFEAVSQYIRTLDNQFLPISKFIEVVALQYKQTQMPELALLKNKLIKYQQAGIFADDVKEFEVLKEKFNESNCVVINIKEANSLLQKEIITYIHKILDSVDNYIYFFVPLNDDNSDKKLIKLLINNSHIFTTMFAPHSYKYASELKNHAQEIMLFAPQDLVHDFAPYNTFLNKLNLQEFVIYGNLTHGVPLIISLEDLDLDLTKEDVFGERHVFIPKNISKEIQVSNDKEHENNDYEDVTLHDYSNNVILTENETSDEIFDEQSPSVSYIPPVENIMEEDTDSNIDNAVDEDFTQDILTEDDLDFIENNQEEVGFGNDITENDEDIPMVPVYTPEEGEEITGDDIGYNKGDEVTHPRYGHGIVEKIIKYGNKTLCSISFDNVGRRLLDPSISEFEKV